MKLFSSGTRLGFFAAFALAFILDLPASSASEAAGDVGAVRLLYSAFGTNSFPPFVINKFGLDKKHGFRLELVAAVTDDARVTALRSGAADVGTLDWHQIALMRNVGVRVVGVAPFLRWGADYTVKPAHSTLGNIGDLKGKRFGIYSHTSLNWIIERTVARKIYRVDLEKEAKIQEASTPLLLGLMEQGQLDATEMFNSQTPAMLATGKFAVLTKVSDLVHQLGLPDTPYLLYAMSVKFATEHPAAAKAFVAAYEDAVHILLTNDEVWIEHGKEMKFTPAVAALFRSEARTDLMAKFAPTTEADIRKVFAVLLANSSPEILGLGALPDGFMTLSYQ